MADRIKIEPERIKEIATRFLASSQENIALSRELKSLIDGITGEWEGKSQERFYSSYKDAHVQLESVSTVLKDVGDELNAIAERFNKADSIK
ncbi:WXG100 family type VII secretion target [Paenibacillus sp. JGP012]|jgi:WXG100 family type VII secretion target|uniref:WXG100 family type VII secretion target n=1 Tax=Paenibacillus TaxID=44249 RepID=UPI00119E8E02|nr:MULTISPECIES: WXG100 family type VII secretion target [Paenibacillus]MBB6020894.1 WXG100 family type VII secretion target [Paenibacillus sp. JGP012]MBU5354929.1 WXG100 family type VII secretion target [Paenibacillus barcinonensis]MDM5281747.1 WXG100 family type VII secretion target [Paenibacillus silvae]